MNRQELQGLHEAYLEIYNQPEVLNELNVGDALRTVGQTVRRIVEPADRAVNQGINAARGTLGLPPKKFDTSGRVRGPQNSAHVGAAIRSTQKEDFEFIDELSDKELDYVMEQILLEGVELSECFEAFDEVLTEARVDMAARAAARKEFRRESEKSASKARRRGAEFDRAEKRAERVERIKSSAKRAADNVSKFASGVGRRVKKGAEDVGGKLSSAKNKIMGFIGRVGSAAKAGYKAAKSEFSGEAERQSNLRRDVRRSIRSARNRAAEERGRDTSAFTQSTSAPSSERRYPTEKSGQTTLFTSPVKGRPSGPVAKVPPGGQKPFGAKRPKKSTETTRQIPLRLNKEESEFIYQSILEDLVNEGYASNFQEAHNIFESFSDYELNQIVENYLVREQADLYDIILSHLLDEGYAETPEAAEVMMVNMSEDWRESILEQVTGTGLGRPMEGETPGHTGPTPPPPVNTKKPRKLIPPPPVK